MSQVELMYKWHLDLLREMAKEKKEHVSLIFFRFSARHIKDPVLLDT